MSKKFLFTTSFHILSYSFCFRSTCHLPVMTCDAIWGWLELAGLTFFPNYAVGGHSYSKSPLCSYKPLMIPATKNLLNWGSRNSSTGLTVRPETTWRGAGSTCRKGGARARCTRDRILLQHWLKEWVLATPFNHDSIFSFIHDVENNPYLTGLMWGLRNIASVKRTVWRPDIQRWTNVSFSVSPVHSALEKRRSQVLWKGSA